VKLLAVKVSRSGPRVQVLDLRIIYVLTLEKTFQLMIPTQ
jgi:hypothetical protein